MPPGVPLRALPRNDRGRKGDRVDEGTDSEDLSGGSVTEDGARGTRGTFGLDSVVRTNPRDRNRQETPQGSDPGLPIEKGRGMTRRDQTFVVPETSHRGRRVYGRESWVGPGRTPSYTIVRTGRVQYLPL